MEFELVGNPGDIAIENINITQNPHGKLPLQRGFTVRRLALNGEWKEIGYYREHFGPEPGFPEEHMWFGESPNGMMYEEPWFTEEEGEKVFRKWDGHFGDNVGIVDFLLQHYQDQAIPA